MCKTTLLSGAERRSSPANDLPYVRDLGLIASNSPPRIANPIYREVVPRELTFGTQATMTQTTASYVAADSGLDLVLLLEDFQDFFRQHSEHWEDRYGYKEAGPQLLLQAFLQKVVNGGGRIEREYGLGRSRTDLLIFRPQGSRVQRFAVECKALRRSLESTIDEGARQIAGYLGRCGAEAGHLVIFDRENGRWEDKLFRKPATIEGVTIEVWGM